MTGIAVGAGALTLLRAILPSGRPTLESPPAGAFGRATEAVTEQVGSLLVNMCLARIGYDAVIQ